MYNHNKVENLAEIERIIREEHSIFRLIDAHPENDAVIFVGADAKGGRMEVVSRLDEYGNADANLGEVTVIVRHKGKGKSPPPNFRPLTEVVEAVAKHQAAGFSPSTTLNMIPQSDPAVNEAAVAKPIAFPQKTETVAECQTPRATFRPLHVLYLGRRHPLKGVEFLEQAIKELNSDLHLDSTPPTPQFALRIVSDHTGAELEADWAWADILCLPTLSENFGRVVAEALERGRRVITTDGAPAWRTYFEQHPDAGIYLKGYRDGSEATRIKLLADALKMFVD